MIAVTTEARTKLTEILDADEASQTNVRVSVVRGPHGCAHGWSLGLEEDAQPRDTVLSFDGWELVVAPDLVDALEGARVDYREDETGIGFLIDAPNARALSGHSGC